jgi:SNF2 family DNA or RNA helicase
LQKGANKVIHLTTPWNPALLKQATERVHRQGQKEKVTTHRTIMANSIDEYIEQIIIKKRAMSDTLLLEGADETRISPAIGYSDFMKIALMNL